MANVQGMVLYNVASGSVYIRNNALPTTFVHDRDIAAQQSINLQRACAASSVIRLEWRYAMIMLSSSLGRVFLP